MKRKLKAVISSQLREVRGGLLGPDTSRRVRMYELQLECGHRVDRFVKYPPRSGPRANGWHPRRLSEALPAPKRALCDECKS